MLGEYGFSNSMVTYLLKRGSLGFLLVIGLIVVTFFLLRFSPGNPASVAYDPNGKASAVARMQDDLGLNKPIGSQFISWVTNMFHGNWGTSYAVHRPIGEILKQTLPNTLFLTIPALLIQLFFGILLGLWQITKKDSLIDRSLSTVNLILYAIPTFWIALVLVMVFSQKLGLLPSSQMLSFTYQEMTIWQRLADGLSHLILPVVSMSLVSVAVISRYVRNCIAEVLNQEYILAARARGLSEKRIFYKHAFRNAMVPLITLIGQHFPALVGSSIVIELIFSWPGMGRLIVFSAFARDYPVIIACTFVMATFVVIGNLLADVISAIVDPRIRLQSQ